MISYVALRRSVESLGFKFFDKGDFNLNLIYERTNDEFTNYMTDWFHVAFKENNLPKVVSIKCSTKAGLYGYGSVTDPLTVNGIKGVCVIAAPQQIEGGFVFIDAAKEMLKEEKDRDIFFWKKWNRCSYLKENKNFLYWRDGDKDRFIDKDNVKVTFNGTHSHVGNEPVNINSIGCIVWPREDFNCRLYPIFVRASKLYGNVVTPTIIESKNIIV